LASQLLSFQLSRGDTLSTTLAESQRVVSVPALCCKHSTNFVVVDAMREDSGGIDVNGN
jgi:hypothetical protein